MHKHNFGQTLNLQSAVFTMNIRLRSLKSNSLFSVSKQNTCIYASLVRNKPLVQKRLNLQFFKDDDLEMR